MQELNLPDFPIKIIDKDGKPYVWDIFRKAYVKLTPEEWVRQNFLWWLSIERGYPKALIAVEAGLRYNKLPKRADAIVFGRSGKPLMIIECKAAGIKITKEVFDQIAGYNYGFGVSYLVVTNGMEHYCCKRETGAGTWLFLDHVPCYKDLNT